jgi:hypothetical protein
MQANDNVREGVVYHLDINTQSTKIADYKPVGAIPVPTQVTGFKVDSDGDGTPDDTSAFPDQLQSIVIRGDTAYLFQVSSTRGFFKRLDTQQSAAVGCIYGF